MKSFFLSLIVLLLSPLLAVSVRIPNADTPLFYLVSSSQNAASNLLPVRINPSGGGDASLTGSGPPAQFYFFQGALTARDASGTTYRPYVNSIQGASGCSAGGAFGFVQGTSTNKCTQYTSFQIQSDQENSQLGANLVFNYVGGFYACGSGQNVFYEKNAADVPSGCSAVTLNTVPVV